MRPLFFRFFTDEISPAFCYNGNSMIPDQNHGDTIQSDAIIMPATGRNTGILILLIVLLSSCISHPRPLPENPYTGTRTGLEISTLNVMYDRTEESMNRITRLKNLLQDSNKDIWFLQEVVSIMPDDFIAPENRIFHMLKTMEEYGIISVDSYSRTGNINPILYNRERFSPVRSGTYWFSHKSFVPDSRSWGNTRPRQMTWAVLYDRAVDNCISMVNLHLDHASPESRRSSVEMLLNVIHLERLNAHPIIIAGDFNSISQSNTANLLTEQFNEAEYPGGSFRRLPMSIDHVFYRGLTELDCRAVPVDVSDHKLISAEFSY